MSTAEQPDEQRKHQIRARVRVLARTRASELADATVVLDSARIGVQGLDWPGKPGKHQLPEPIVAFAGGIEAVWGARSPPRL
jgi:hypothetical protein